MSFPGGAGPDPPLTGGEFLLSLLQKSPQHQQQQQNHQVQDPSITASFGPSPLPPSFYGLLGSNQPRHQSSHIPTHFRGFTADGIAPALRNSDSGGLGFRPRQEPLLTFGSFHAPIHNGNALLNGNLINSRNVGLSSFSTDFDRNGARPPPGFVVAGRGVGRTDLFEGDLAEMTILEDSGLGKQIDHPGPPAGSMIHSVGASRQEPLLTFGSFHAPIHNGDTLLNENLMNSRNVGLSSFSTDFDRNGARPPPGFVVAGRGVGRRDLFEGDLGLGKQLDHPGPPAGSMLHSVGASDVEESMLLLHANVGGESKNSLTSKDLLDEDDEDEIEELSEKIGDSLVIDDDDGVDTNSKKSIRNRCKALVKTRVPIVKLMDPATEISCDISINNVLAVVNTKLLRDYAQIDVRLRQLAFVVKHWAKSRRVNKTYHGTLSSYAYVLMCINFLQQRRPAILPCLQKMETTYSVTIENVHCAFFDRVDRLQGFGHRNNESISQLVWSFFSYWAYVHDYANSVISVRNGTLLSKKEKDWNKRIGIDRHVICIEDPFETSHDVGRSVDKRSLKVIREEFERAAEVLYNDPNPCVKLFEPYVPS